MIILYIIFKSSLVITTIRMADLFQKMVTSKIGTADTRKLEDTKGWDFSDESGSGGASITPFNPGETSFAASVNLT